MILDLIAQCARYVAWQPELAAGFAFLIERADPTLAAGRHEIDGERCFALVSNYQTRGLDEAFPEAHRRYLDIQVLIAGRETILWTPLAEAAAPRDPYDPSRDIIFFERNDRGRPFELAAGHFAIFFPEDVHQPGCRCGAPMPVHKVVVKVELAHS